MPKFRFLGTDACPDEIMLRDVVFRQDKPVEVTDADLCKKLAALPYFAEVKAGRPKKNDQDGD
jgi:hypothetical protein